MIDLFVMKRVFIQPRPELVRSYARGPLEHQTETRILHGFGVGYSGAAGLSLMCDQRLHFAKDQCWLEDLSDWGRRQGRHNFDVFRPRGERSGIALCA